MNDYKTPSDTNQTTFRSGDLVRLKSGGPVMTLIVRSIDVSPNRAYINFDGERNYLCQWFEREDRDLCEGFFPLAALQRALDLDGEILTESEAAAPSKATT